jgi:hypothetical protein
MAFLRGSQMFHKLLVYWGILATLLMGGFLPITLTAQEIRMLSAAEQGAKETPCPLCGQPWRGQVDPEMAIPEKLPTPQNQFWISKLSRALALEKLAKAQYEADQKKFGITNPYRFIIPQIDQHITWINKLFAAYGLAAEEKSASLKTPDTILQAFKNGKKLETDIARQYEWLLNEAEDKITKRVLNTMLTKTNLDIIMFQNNIRILEIEGSMTPLLL